MGISFLLLRLFSAQVRDDWLVGEMPCREGERERKRNISRTTTHSIMVERTNNTLLANVGQRVRRALKRSFILGNEK